VKLEARRLPRRFVRNPRRRFFRQIHQLRVERLEILRIEDVDHRNVLEGFLHLVVTFGADGLTEGRVAYVQVFSGNYASVRCP
jgi:hypothetical protein